MVDSGTGTGHGGTERLPLRVRLRLWFLTPRGWALFVAGAVALLLAWFLGRRELVNISIFLLVAPLLSAAAVALGRTRVKVRRSFGPDPVITGGSTTVTLSLGHGSPLPAGTALDEQLPRDFGTTPSFSADAPGQAGSAGQRTAYRYRLRPTHRGVYAVGPLRVQLSDPFGLAMRPIAVDRPTPLTVVPPVLPLPETGVLGSTGTRGTATSHHQATPENDDVMTREYRDGDSLRRVHWPATARHNTLMVRQEQFQRTPRATLVVDTRALPYQGSYIGADAPTPIPNFQDAPGTTTPCFDWTIGAVVSMGAHLADQGYDLEVLDESGLPLADAAPGSPGAGNGWFSGPQAAEDLQLSLASVGLKPAPSRPRDAPAEAPDFLPRGGNNPVLLFTGAPTADGAEAWIHRLGTHRGVLVFLIASRPGATTAGLRAFRAAGWTAVPVDAKTPVADAWLELAAQQRRTGVRGRS
ncbi:MAG: DUF58 domain-containing protein [Micrococcaceae bacterium]|nr:DUF58 domain-containing protein [Micrococcaceae bacterium]